MASGLHETAACQRIFLPTSRLLYHLWLLLVATTTLHHPADGAQAALAMSGNAMQVSHKQITGSAAVTTKAWTAQEGRCTQRGTTLPGQPQADASEACACSSAPSDDRKHHTRVSGLKQRGLLQTCADSMLPKEEGDILSGEAHGQMKRSTKRFQL